MYPKAADGRKAGCPLAKLGRGLYISFMHGYPDIFRPCGVRLERRDLIRHEHALKDALAGFIGFKSYSLYFPSDPPREPTPRYLPGERKLLVPLIRDGGFLGMFMARGVKILAPKTVLPLIEQAAALCLENLRLVKAASSDRVTGLANADCLAAALEREVGLVQSCILPGSADCLEDGAGPARGSFGLVILDLDYFSWINREYGFLFGETVLARAGAILAGLVPAEALAARLGEDVFAVLLPGASPSRCREAAEAFRKALGAEIFEYPANGERLHLTASAGFVTYPRDLQGGQLAQPAGEQARVLLKKARKTLACAKDLGRDQVMSFSRLLREGGQVLEVLPLGRLVANLGAGVDAKEGQRFLVWSPRSEGQAHIRRGEDQRLIGRYPALVKGEVILMEVQQDMSFAEVLHVNDPSLAVAAGDRLLLAQEPENGYAAGTDPAAQPSRDMASGLLSHRDFMRRLGQWREKDTLFSLALLRLPDADKDRPQPGDSPAEARIQELAALCRDCFGQDIRGGRFSTLSLALYLPGQDPIALSERFVRLCGLVRDRLGLALAVGLAGYPFLGFHKSDVLGNCRKALEHSLLLAGEPRLAVFDSISLTISADRLFSLGDLYAAVEDYKLALLADENNLLARNSLGVCLARLGRMDQAKAEFDRVLAIDPKNVVALYNRGHAHQRLGEPAGARKDFQRCRKLKGEDVYSLLRLGRLAEESGKLATARKYYEKAALLPEGAGLTMRHLARLSLAAKQAEKAREYLHKALLHDPKDAFSMNLLAKLYLDQGEDPAIAEVLARQSAALRPDQKPFWKELARSLEVQGRKDEAARAMSRAL